MIVGERTKGGAGRSSVAFSETLAALLGARTMSLHDLLLATGLEARYLESLLDGSKEPPRGVIEVVARGLDLPPEHFLEYRIGAARDALGRDPERANELFLRSLTEIERQNLDVSSFDNRPFAEAVRALLIEEEMTQGELAENIGLSQSELSRMLNHRRKLPTDLAETIAQALGASPEFFLEHRLALVEEWFRETPEEVDALLEGLERGVELPPYEAWPPRPLPDPRRVSLVELSQSLIEIIKVEGPVVGARLYVLRLRAAGLGQETKALRSLLNRASYATMRAGAVIGVNERDERTQKYLVLRLPGVPEVRMRARGDRTVPEIPLSEVRTVVKATSAYKYGEGVEAIQNEVFAAYQLPRPGLADLEHVNRAISMRATGER